MTDSANFQSLNVVRDELVATIERSARDLEVFVGSPDDGQSLQACIDGVRQIVGILKLIQFRGAVMLAEELLANATDITVGDNGAQYEKRLETISSSFFILSRYLEYVQQNQRRVPVLLIHPINQLRRLRNQPPIPESHFFNINAECDYPVPAVNATPVAPEDFKPLLRRVRHMYQLGLLAILQNKPNVPALKMMRRALVRLQQISGSDRALAALWWVGDITLDALSRHNVELIEPRKLTLSRLDRVIKQVAQGGPRALDARPPKALLKELIYLLNLSGDESSAAEALRQACNLSKLPYTDRDLARERRALHGPSAHTVTSLARVLRTELGHTKKVLENAAQAEDSQIDDIDGFIKTLDKVSEILLVVGLSAPGQTLKRETEKVRNWKSAGTSPSAEDLQGVANTLLYVESTAASLENANLSDAKLAEANEIMQQEIIASGELAEAQRIVIAESEAALSLTKRALNAYSESDFDSGHIRNIAKTLTSVRGGMYILKRYRAANILDRCVLFVEDVLMQPNHPPAMQELLETFADAIISVEYYLDAGGIRADADESVLRLGEESLEALGYPVEAA